MTMTPLGTILMVLGILLGIAAIAMFGAVLGSKGTTKPRRPPMTIQVLDCSEMKHGIPPVDRWIKYHPSTGFYTSKVPDPTAQGKVRVMEKCGAFGRRKEWWTWDEIDIVIIGTGKTARGIYKAENLGVVARQGIEKLQYELSIQAEELGELRRDNLELKRNVPEQVAEMMDQRVKEVTRMMPVPMNRKPTNQGQGGR